MRNDRTTDLDAIRKGAPYTWGIVINIYDMGPRYTIVESHRPLEEGEPRTSFACYVDGKDLHSSSRSIEGALLLCISHGCIPNPNDARYMAYAAAKLLSVKED